MKFHNAHGRLSGWPPRALAMWAIAGVLTGCGGSGDTSEASAERQAQSTSVSAVTAAVEVTQADAVRLAQQASFGPNDALLAQIKSQGAPGWIKAQMAASGSVYSSGGDDKIHTRTSQVAFCDSGVQKDNENCWRDYYAADPLAWDFFRNATEQPDQLRQRVAMALSHILVVSAVEVNGTYGLRYYQNQLLSGALGNYRDILEKVVRSPVMGDYLDHANNDRYAPNENFARELLQLFSLGTCKLQPDGSLSGGRCKPVYNNEIVRNYAYALTGWTYPRGGRTPWGCWPAGANCPYYEGEMVSAPKLRDNKSRALLSSVTVATNTDAPKALDAVLDSLMRHGNMAPFISKRLIQHLVMGDPAPAYIGRVAAVFKAGSFSFADASGTYTFGTGKTGDLAATVAAVLLDADARDPSPNVARAGRLRSPALLFTGALRALNGHTDGHALIWWWGESLHHHMFMSPSVFGFYPSAYPVPGTDRNGPEFGLHNANGALERLNYLMYLIEWGGSPPEASVPRAIGTGVDLSGFLDDAGQAPVLVDRLSLLTLGQALPAVPRQKIIQAVNFWTKETDAKNWRERRVKAAAYLVLGSPDYQVQR